MPAKSHRDLEVWQRSMDLVEATYRVARGLPKHEVFGLASQLRRASVSVPANIAEGYGRLHRGDYVRHLSIAAGSLRELTTLIEVTCRIGYADDDELHTVTSLSDRVGAMLHRMLARLQERKITLHLSDAARQALVDEGYDPLYGARPLKRTLQKRVLDPLAMAVLQGEFREGDEVTLDVVDGALQFEKRHAVVH